SGPNVGVGGQVPDDVVVPHRRGQSGRVEQISVDEREVSILEPTLDPLQASARQVVVDRHPVTLGEKTVHELTANEAGAAGDEGARARWCVHGRGDLTAAGPNGSDPPASIPDELTSRRTA